MTVTDLADYMRANMPGINYPGVHLLESTSVVLQMSRDSLGKFFRITDEHIFECCAKANSFEEHIALCLPLAKADTENFERERLKPPPKGMTRRRFR